jgi:cysteine desulfurase
VRADRPRRALNSSKSPSTCHGRLDFDGVDAALNDDTALVTTMWANNETGVLFEVDRIAAMCKAKRVPFHCDGTQAVGKIPVNVAALGVDAMSFAAHKFHGPKGVGALFARRGAPRPPAADRRPAGARPARGDGERARHRRHGQGRGNGGGEPAEMSRVAALRDRLEAGILSSVPDAAVNGRTDLRLPNTTNVGFARLEAEAILILLSEQGVCASAGAACSSGSLEPSHVLRAMGIDEKIAHGAIRFSLSRYTSDAEVDRALQLLPKVIAKLRAVLPVAG